MAAVEMDGYIIPPPMESQQCIKTLNPDKKHDQARRCGCNTSREDLEQSRRLTSELEGQTVDETILDRIILLRVCKNRHRTMLEQSGTLRSLAKVYEKTLTESEMTKLPFRPRNEDLFERHCSTERGSTVSDILKQNINPRQDAQGSLYIFNWPRQPGFLKIGYAKRPAGERVNTWQLCHPEATSLYEIEVAFPERMEQLIHAELAGKRHSLREGCSRCATKHKEWFAVTFDEAQRVVMGWSEIAASPLYAKDRTLSLEWSRIVRSLSQVTASTLSPHLKKYPSNDTSMTSSISKEPETSSPGRILSQMEHLVVSSLSQPLAKKTDMLVD